MPLDDPTSHRQYSTSPLGGYATKRSINSNNIKTTTTSAATIPMVPSIQHDNSISRTLRKFSSVKVAVLIVLSLQNSLFTLLRRYSLGVRKEEYSKYELLLVGEIIKLLFSAYMIQQGLSPISTPPSSGNGDLLVNNNTTNSLTTRLVYLFQTSSKMMGLALIYGCMNILSLVALRNIGAGVFTIFAQTKILTTAVFSTLLLSRRYSWTKWRALAALSLGVLLFSEPQWRDAGDGTSFNSGTALGIMAVMTEVTLSGFASIYFEKVIKTDPLRLSIWERNFQLALGSVPVYIVFMIGSSTDQPFFHGWSWLAVLVSLLGAAGGLLVALSIKYGDAILKTLATTAAIVLSSVMDRMFLGGTLTPISVLAGVQVVVAICNYTFDATPNDATGGMMLPKDSHRDESLNTTGETQNDEEMSLLSKKTEEST